MRLLRHDNRLERRLELGLSLREPSEVAPTQHVLHLVACHHDREPYVTNCTGPSEGEQVTSRFEYTHGFGPHRPIEGHSGRVPLITCDVQLVR